MTARSASYVNAMERGRLRMPDMMAISAVHALARFIEKYEETLDLSEIAELVAIGSVLIPDANNQVAAKNKLDASLQASAIVYDWADRECGRV